MNDQDLYVVESGKCLSITLAPRDTAAKTASSF